MTAAEHSGPGITAGPQWTRRPASLANALAAELVSRIVRGQHPAGSVLPPEPALCQAFSVSRTVVREAVKMLQEKGLVQVRQGSGTTVTPQSMWNFLDELVLAASIAESDGRDVLDDLVVTRRLLEADMAHVAARLATADVAEGLLALVDRMDGLVDDAMAYADQDRTFHDLIMQTSGNRIARGVVRALESQVLSTYRYMGEPRRDHCVASNQGHRRIAERIMTGAEGAVVSFEGTVRNNTGGRPTLCLDYEGYESMALKTMARLGLEIAAGYEVGRVAMVHRLGRMLVGETSVAVVVCAPHRRPAFEAALEGIDRLKRLVPIWKKEHFADGEVWVEGEWDRDVPVVG